MSNAPVAAFRRVDGPMLTSSSPEDCGQEDEAGTQAGSMTCTSASPGSAVSAAGTVAVIWMWETYVVANGAPSQRTCEVRLKPSPAMVIVCAVPTARFAGATLTAAKGTSMTAISNRVVM